MPNWRLEVFDALGSTSDLCAGRAAAGEPEGLAILARQQTAGRGSHGRNWASPPGNLSLSVLLRPAIIPSQAAWWSLLVGLAMAETLSASLPPEHLPTLKWPNDVMLAGGKLAGVLIETTLTPAGLVAAMVLGLGANLASAPPLADRRAACVADHAPPPDPVAFARHLLGRIDAWRARLDAEGVAPLRAAWLARAHPLGTPLLVKVGEVHTPGRFAGLSEDGHLLLTDADGRQRRISAGVLVG